MKRWLHKILATIVVRLGAYVAERIDYDILCEVTQKYSERMRANQTLKPTYGDVLTYERLKKIEDEWVERVIIG